MDAQYWIPTVSQDGRFLDIYSAMLADGIIFVNAPINQRVAGLVASSLLHIDRLARASKQAKLYLNSKEGDLVAAMSIVDIMEHYKKKVPLHTVGLGELGIAGSVILAAGSKGCRRAASHAKLSLYVGLSHFDFPNIQSAEMKSSQGEGIKQEMIAMLAHYSGQDPMFFRMRLNSEQYLTASEAIKFGLIDEAI